MKVLPFLHNTRNHLCTDTVTSQMIWILSSIALRTWNCTSIFFNPEAFPIFSSVCLSCFSNILLSVSLLTDQDVLPDNSIRSPCFMPSELCLLSCHPNSILTLRLYCITATWTVLFLFFYIHGSVHQNSILIRSNEMQQYAGIYLLQNHSTLHYMFRVSIATIIRST